MKHFTIEELCASPTAKAKGIDNTPPDKVVENLNILVENLLDPLRERYGKPIYVNSGYRCPKLNQAVGGSKTSQHMKGEAADIDTRTKEGNRRLAKLLIDSGLEFDQLIDEMNYSWLHVSYKEENNRRQILRYSNKTYKIIKPEQL